MSSRLGSLRSSHTAIAVALFLVACAGASSSSAPSTKPTITAPAPTSWKIRAAAYLDERAIDDVERPPHISELSQNLDCTANCHTSLPYLIARPLLPGGEATLDRVRTSIEQRVDAIKDWHSTTPWFGEPGTKLGIRSLGTESVINASSLVMGDVARARPLSSRSTRALDLMWSAQRDDGAWDWFDFKFEPFETGDDCGVALASILIGALPRDARDSARVHVDKLMTYVRARVANTAQPPKLHQKALVLWASDRWSELLDKESRSSLADELVAKQRPDGGWSLATWGGGKLADANGASDGYATALASLALCEGHFAPASVGRGVAWLTRSQREDGSWPGHSVNTKAELNTTFMTDAATAYAVLALARCVP